MTLERRHFMKTGTIGLAACLVNQELARAQVSSTSLRGELEGGTSSVRLEGKLKSGVLKLQAQDFVEGMDRSLIVRGEFDSADLYCAMFSYNHDQKVFALFRDHGHSTTLVLSDSDDRKVGTLVVGNDGGTPETFRVDKEKFMDTENLKASILDGKGEHLNVLGNRKPPDITSKELEVVFGDNPALREFMRGRRSTHHPAASEKLDAWICHLLSLLPGSLFPLFWAAY
jgi:hypothetical protein